MAMVGAIEPVTSTLLALSGTSDSTLLALSDRGAGVPVRELVLVGLTAAIVTYFATGGARILALRLGAVAYPRERDVHSRPTPRMGGLAMYLGVVTAVFLASPASDVWVRRPWTSPGSPPADMTPTMSAI